MLTELEGAILAELQTRGQDTAFKIRSAFASSLSLEWKGSAGSIYPAVKRLEARGLIRASAPQGGRGTRLLSITPLGASALLDWACDAKLATNVGLDPFRLRSNLWMQLEVSKRHEVLAALKAELLDSLQQFQRSFDETVPSEQIRVALAMKVQRERVRLLEEWSSDGVKEN